MYQTLLFFHSIVRWLVLTGLILSIARAYKGYTSKIVFGKRDNALRYWTTTIAHIQLMIGMILYTQSPAVRYLWSNFREGIRNTEASFFGVIHIALVLFAIVLITVGSALSKRKKSNSEKFKTMLIWFSISLIILIIAIPWPFSPFVSRPYLR